AAPHPDRGAVRDGVLRDAAGLSDVRGRAAGDQPEDPGEAARARRGLRGRRPHAGAHRCPQGPQERRRAAAPHLAASSSLIASSKATYGGAPEPTPPTSTPFCTRPRTKAGVPLMPSASAAAALAAMAAS